MNSIIISGRICNDIELKVSGAGSEYTNFSVAVDRERKDKDGNNRRTAEVVAENVYFGDSKRDGAGESGYGAPAYGAPPAYGGGYGAGESSGFSEIADDDGDLPF
mgnify:CR=1 FL=1